MLNVWKLHHERQLSRKFTSICIHDFRCSLFSLQVINALFFHMGVDFYSKAVTQNTQKLSFHKRKKKERTVLTNKMYLTLLFLRMTAFSHCYFLHFSLFQKESPPSITLSLPFPQHFQYISFHDALLNLHAIHYFYWGSLHPPLPCLFRFLSLKLSWALFERRANYFALP